MARLLLVSQRRIRKMSRTKAFRGDFFAVDTEAYTFIDGEKWSEERIFEKAR